TDTRLHENFRRVHRTQRKYRFILSLELPALPFSHNLDADHPATIEQKAGHQRTGEYGQVAIAGDWRDVGLEYRLPLTVSDAKFSNGGAAVAFHHLPVGRVEDRDAKIFRGLEHGVSTRLRRVGLRHIGRTAEAPAKIVGLALPVFDPPIIAESRFVSPGVITGLGGKMVPILLMAA